MRLTDPQARKLMNWLRDELEDQPPLAEHERIIIEPGRTNAFAEPIYINVGVAGRGVRYREEFLRCP